VGENVKRFAPGDEVIGVLSDFGFGGFAEYAVAPEAGLAHKPKNVSFEDSAALPLAGITALQALRDKGHLQSGQEVLIIGSGGGVGTFAVQLAKLFGARVTAVCSARNLQQTKSLGADEVLDYAQDDFTKRIGAYDLIIAVNGNYPLSACMKCLKLGGKYVMIGGELPQIFKALLLGKLMSIGSKKVYSQMTKSNRDDLESIVKLTAEGRIRPLIDKSYPLEQTPEAMRYTAAGHARGKVTIKVR
jgi:NADPH:quinone reductase-like Zn-dependent oxidoreductase